DLGHGQQGLSKLDAGPDVADDGARTSAGALADLPSDRRLAPIFRAIGDRATVSFTYNGTPRTVRPYRLEFQRGRWYLTGFDETRADERNYRVERIEGDVTIGKPGSFVVPETNVAGSPTQPWQFGEGEPLVARVRVDHE